MRRKPDVLPKLTLLIFIPSFKGRHGLSPGLLCTTEKEIIRFLKDCWILAQNSY